ncbi:MAG TPA: hypothetical protein DDY57_03825 [Franconibacter pulveris]|nr:hypothetical protein [Franconibacter pulveris]
MHLIIIAPRFTFRPAKKLCGRNKEYDALTVLQARQAAADKAVRLAARQNKWLLKKAKQK